VPAVAKFNLWYPDCGSTGFYRVGLLSFYRTVQSIGGAGLCEKTRALSFSLSHGLSWLGKDLGMSKSMAGWGRVCSGAWKNKDGAWQKREGSLRRLPPPASGRLPGCSVDMGAVYSPSSRTRQVEAM